MLDPIFFLNSLLQRMLEIRTYILMLLNFLKRLVISKCMIYKQSLQIQVNNISSVLKLKYMPRNMCYGQKISYLAPTVWNYLPIILKLSATLNSFNHKAKEHFYFFFEELKNKEQDIFTI